MKTANTSIALVIAWALTSAAIRPSNYMTPSYALAHADELDGKKVTIGGVVDIGTNSRCLYDSLQAAQGKGGGWATGDYVVRRRQPASEAKGT